MNLREFLSKELRSFVAEAVRPSQPAPTKPDEGKLIERASEGAEARGILESRLFQEFMTQSEANLTTALINLPLDDNDGRRNLAVAIQTQRAWVRYLAELSKGGRSAEAELERLQKPTRGYF